MTSPYRMVRSQSGTSRKRSKPTGFGLGPASVIRVNFPGTAGQYVAWAWHGASLASAIDVHSDSAIVLGFEEGGGVSGTPYQITHPGYGNRLWPGRSTTNGAARSIRVIGDNLIVPRWTGSVWAVQSVAIADLSLNWSTPFSSDETPPYFWVTSAGVTYVHQGNSNQITKLAADGSPIWTVTGSGSLNLLAAGPGLIWTSDSFGQFVNSPSDGNAIGVSSVNVVSFAYEMIGDDLIFIDSNTAKVTRAHFNQSTGVTSVVWVASEALPVNLGPMALCIGDDGYVYAAGYGVVQQIDPGTGAVNWRYLGFGQAPPSAARVSGVAKKGGALYIAGDLCQGYTL